MKKSLFSLLLIGTFTTYALYVQQNTQSLNTPLALDKKQPMARTDATSSNNVAVAPLPPISTPPTSTPVANLLPPPVNDQLTLQAQGKVKLTNTYPSALTLVKTTRLLTSDGKLYHLAQTVSVPAHGQILADIYADQNGSLYAIAPSTFSVPGLPTILQPYITAASESPLVLAQPIILVADVPPTPTPKPTPTPTPTPVKPPVTQPVTPPTPVVVPPPQTKPKGAYQDGTYTGDSVDAYYGNVQVAAIIQNEKITDVKFLDHPQDRNRSIAINNYAMPNLRSEAIQAQNANVDVVSGATATSDAFIQSLGSALAQAKN